MSQNVYQKTCRILFLLSFVVASLGSASLSPSYAMDEGEKEGGQKRARQQAELDQTDNEQGNQKKPRPKGQEQTFSATLPFLFKNKTVQSLVPEQTEQSLVPELRSALKWQWNEQVISYLSNLPFQIIGKDYPVKILPVSTRNIEWIIGTPEFFTLITPGSGGDYDVMVLDLFSTKPETKIPYYMVKLNEEKIRRYNPESASIVRNYISTHASTLLPKFEACCAVADKETLESYGPLMALDFSERFCYAYALSFPNQIFNENMRIEDFHVLSQNVYRKSHPGLTDLVCCLSNFPTGLIELLFKWIGNIMLYY